jgi:hypothetical protein
MHRETAFLSDRKRQILDGKDADELGIAGGTYREHKAVTRDKALAAITDLCRVANSPEIDNKEIFTPKNVAVLIRSIMTDPYHRERGLVGEDSSQYSDEFEPYRSEMYFAIDDAIQQYREDIRRERPDPTEGGLRE